MQHLTHKTKAALQSAAAFAVSASLLITVCFAPVMAQTKDHHFYDNTSYHRPITTGYLA
jgi:hypothetical protein